MFAHVIGELVKEGFPNGGVLNEVPDLLMGDKGKYDIEDGCFGEILGAIIKLTAYFQQLEVLIF